MDERRSVIVRDEIVRLEKIRLVLSR